MRLRDLYSSSIFKKMILFSICISIIPLILVSVLMYVQIYEKMEKEIISSHKQIVNQSMQNMEEKLGLLQFQLAQIAESTLVKDTIVNEKLSPLERGIIISKEVVNILAIGGNVTVEDCMLYITKEDIPTYGQNVSMMSQGRRESWGQILGGLDHKSYIYSVRNTALLTLVEDITLVDERQFITDKLGKVKLDMKINGLFSNVQEANSYKVCVFSEASRTPVYQSGEIEAAVLDEFFLEKGKLSADSENPVIINSYIVYEEFNETYGMNVVFLFEKTNYDNITRDVLKLYLPVLLILFVIIVAVSLRYCMHFSERVEFVLKKIRYVEEGDLVVHDSLSGNDEIAMMDSEINRMIKKLNRLIEKNYIQKIENKQIELQNLRLQINPHFLYNTLEVVSSIAAVEKSFVICDICECLGEILRYSLGKRQGEFVDLKQEIFHTRNYLYIQQVRFADRFDVVYNIDDKLMERKVPRFILQPIVENAILHGLINKQGKGRIEISAYEDQESLIIQVKDDGKGMSPEEFDKVKNMLADLESKPKDNNSIGISNVNRRIKVLCGSKYGVDVSSIPDQGSCFQLMLPLL